MVGRVAEDISQRIGMDVVDSIEERTLLEEALDRVKCNSAVLLIHYVLVYVLNDSFLLDLERIPSCFSAFGKFDFFLKKFIELMDHIF